MTALPYQVHLSIRGMRQKEIRAIKKKKKVVQKEKTATRPRRVDLRRIQRMRTKCGLKTLKKNKRVG